MDECSICGSKFGVKYDKYHDIICAICYSNILKNNGYKTPTPSDITVDISVTREHIGDFNGCPITVTWPGEQEVAEQLARATMFRFRDEEHGYESQWDTLQEYMTMRNEDPDSTPEAVGAEYSISLATKRTRRQANYNINEDRDILEVKITCAYRTGDEAKGAVGGRDVVRSRQVIGTIPIYDLISDNALWSEDGKRILNWADIISEFEHGKQQEYKLLVTVTESGTVPHFKLPRNGVVYNKQYFPNQCTHNIYRKSSVPINRDIYRVDGKIITDGQQKLREFYDQFELSKKNFVGHANKKSDGRNPDGWLDVDAMKHNKHRHGVSMELIPMVRTRETTRIVKFKQSPQKPKKGEVRPTNVVKLGEVDRTIQVIEGVQYCYAETFEAYGHAGISHIPKICLCNYKLKDLRRGDIVCPECGHVYGTAGLI